MSKNKKISILLFILLLSSVLGFMVINGKLFTDENTSPDVTDRVNLEPPTQEETEQGNSQKEAILNREIAVENNTQSSGTKRPVSPQITYADDYGEVIEVAAIVNGVFEDDGTCKATFSHEQYSFEKTISAVASSSSMSCPTIKVPQSDFSVLGTWQITVEYVSTSSSGKSKAVSVDVR